MKKINFNVPMINLAGITLKVDNQDMTAKEMVANALCLTKPKKVMEAVKRLDSALKIYKSTEPIDIEDSEAEMIKQAVIESGFSTLVCGQLIKLLNGEKLL